MSACTLPLFVHRAREVPQAVLGGGPQWVETWECPDPGCSAERERHPLQMPCRWSWQYAHGNAFNGQRFPTRSCLRCAHVERAGHPAQAVEAG